MKRLLIVVAAASGLMCSSGYAANNNTNSQLATGNQTTVQSPPTTTQATGNQTKMQSPQETNKTKGTAFLATNKSKPGVITLASGLQYKIIVAGTGKKPGLSDSVTVHYTGTLINGTKFDSSYDRGQPASFPLMGVIPGWTEALQLMNVGSTWELYIPANLAYGSRGAPPFIGSDETLIFKVELISINKP